MWSTYRDVFTLENSAEQKSLFDARNFPIINKSILGKLALSALIIPGFIFVNFCLSGKKGFNNTNIISVDIKSEELAKVMGLNKQQYMTIMMVYIDITSFALIGV